MMSLKAVSVLAFELPCLSVQSRMFYEVLSLPSADEAPPCPVTSQMCVQCTCPQPGLVAPPMAGHLRREHSQYVISVSLLSVLSGLERRLPETQSILIKVLHPTKEKIKPNNLKSFALLLLLNPCAQDTEVSCGILCPICKIKSWPVGSFSWGPGSTGTWAGKAHTLMSQSLSQIELSSQRKHSLPSS